MRAFTHRLGRVPVVAGILICWMVVGAALFCVGVARAEIRVDITRGTIEPVPIAIPSFVGGGGQEGRVGADIAKVVSADLERSGLFKLIDPKSFIQDAASLNQAPRFPDWRVLNAQALVGGMVSGQGDGRLRVEFRLWDVIAEAQLTGMAYTTTAAGWRRIAHIIADAIYKRITGEDGYFDTQIVYIAESGPATQRVKRLAIMDQDGENHQYLTDGRTLVLTPRFSPSAREITYLSYFNKKPRVNLFNIDNARHEVLGDFPGMTFAPRFSPDGNKVVMSLAEGANSNIYTLDLRTRQQNRLTNSNSIDTSPSYSPDGSQIVFESDRGGSQQLYVMSAGGGGAQRISNGQGRYGGPVWSPRGDLIAFTKIVGGHFAIGVIRPDGTGERILAESYHIEGPTWAPNGRVLMFFRESPSSDGRSRSARLYSINLFGNNERSVVTPVDGSDPAWSPLIP
ncbi:Tol-Pal system protein TolB [Azospirillaceae bacterium]